MYPNLGEMAGNFRLDRIGGAWDFFWLLFRAVFDTMLQEGSEG